MPVALGQTGFGAEVRVVTQRRAEQLVEQGLAERHARGVVFTRDLTGSLRRREVEGAQTAAATGRPFNPSAPGEYVAGTYRQCFRLASGRFAATTTPHPSSASLVATSRASLAMMAASARDSGATGDCGFSGLFRRALLSCKTVGGDLVAIEIASVARECIGSPTSRSDRAFVDPASSESRLMERSDC